jgi:hypothetical protein
MVKIRRALRPADGYTELDAGFKQNAYRLAHKGTVGSALATDVDTTPHAANRAANAQTTLRASRLLEPPGI